MDQALLISIPFSVVTGLIVHYFGIKAAHRWKWMDIPTNRRRHSHPVPLIGGSCVILTWVISLIFYSLQQPQWHTEYISSILPMGFSLLVLQILGLVDDLRGLGPKFKFLVQGIVAVIVLTFEPQVHEICMHWRSVVGPLVWPLAVMWIVGVTNAINLIDGLDGLAGGTILLVSSSILTLSIWTGGTAYFATVSMALLIPSLLTFLRYNWNPAKIFLGDNGSLPLGFMLANASLMCRPQTKSWIMIASLVLMLGFPILDTGLATFRRFQKNLPLFQADRNHLHFRILRLGLTVKQTALLLLSIGLYLQITSLSINLLDPAAAAIGIALVGFSIFSLMLIIRSIETWRIGRIFTNLGNVPELNASPITSKIYSLLVIELDPLLEAGMSEEKSRYRELVYALQVMLKANIRMTDLLLMSDRKISIILSDFDGDEEGVIKRFKERIQSFLSLYSLQCSLSSLPVSLEKRPIIFRQNENSPAIAPLAVETKETA
jgi:UDP-GlcNAc:undecaprenyl-phosphate/decaprenyl-phosphate GlcNAc-1-phosphate transferase